MGKPSPVLLAVKFAVCPFPSSRPPSCGEVSLTKSVARLVRPEPFPVIMPVKNISPSLLNVIPLPTLTPALAVMSPTESR